MGADSVRLFKLLLIAGSIFASGQPILCAFLFGLLIVLLYGDHQWFRPKLLRYTKRATAAITELLAQCEYSTASDRINGFAWVRFFGHQPLVLELMGHLALAKQEYRLAITYFERAIIGLPSDQAIDAHFGVLRGHLCAGDLEAVQVKAEAMQVLYRNDTFVELRLETLLNQSD